MGGDTTRNMKSNFPEINKMCNVASCWKYIKRNILAMHVTLNIIYVDLNLKMIMNLKLTAVRKDLIQYINPHSSDGKQSEIKPRSLGFSPGPFYV